MSELTEVSELKKIVLEMSQRISSLESIVATSQATSKPFKLISRSEEHINELVILGRDNEKCLCGIKSNVGDKHIPIIELNTFNLKAFINIVERALCRGEDTVILENYKQNDQYASYKRGSWEVMT